MFNLANFCTAANLVSGCLAIVLALTGHLDLAPFAILTGLLFDFFDGFFARILKTSGELGKQLDSLADMVTFGVAPGMIMLVWLATDPTKIHEFGALDPDIFLQWMNDALHFQTSNYLPLVAFMFPFFALFRLANFNIDTRQSHSFIGLPTPAATLFFMSFPLALHFHPEQLESGLFAWLSQPIFVCTALVVMSILMVSPLPLFALKFKNFGWKGNEIRYTFLLISLGLIPLFGVWSFSLIVFLYLLFSIIQNTFSKQKAV